MRKLLRCVGASFAVLTNILQQDATELLNAALLERSPDDPPPPRRSTRVVADEPALDDVKKPAKKGRNKKGQSADEPARAEVDDSTFTDPQDELSASQERATPKRKRSARNVGGWISPEFSSELDRSWLTNDPVDATFRLESYVPQVGDTIL